MVVVKINKEQFLSDPATCLNSAAAGDYVTVLTGNGNNVVMIDECEWTMLTQALSICMEHPEWTIKKS